MLKDMKKFSKYASAAGKKQSLQLDHPLGLLICMKE